MRLVHPNMRMHLYTDIEDYKIAMAEWNEMYNSKEKMLAESNYRRYLERSLKPMATFNIKKRENSPEFVIGSFGCKLGDLEPFVNSKGYINFDILKGKEGGMYIKINEYGLDKPTDNTETVTKIEEMTDDEIPF